jgi:RimJ/RimL family protein N-acetyltransferase
VKLRFVRIGRPLADALERGAGDLEAFVSGRLGPYSLLVREVVELTLAMPLAPASEPWGGYLAVDEATGEIVGTCAFKSAPEQGEVEIAYFTFPAYERRGYATAMAGQLCTIAAASPGVRCVVAHTLAQPSASTRILTRLGFARTGERVHPEDGLIWRWERPVAAQR